MEIGLMENLPTSFRLTVDAVAQLDANSLSHWSSEKRAFNKLTKRYHHLQRTYNVIR